MRIARLSYMEETFVLVGNNGNEYEATRKTWYVDGKEEDYEWELYDEDSEPYALMPSQEESYERLYQQRKCA